MTIGRAFVYPDEQGRLRERVRRLSWLSIILLSSAAILLFLTLGQSQAMKTAWIGDMLTLVPPVAMLLAMRWERREPTKRFPFGYTRAVALAFLVTSGVLAVIGLYLLYDALTKLIGQERPPIGTIELFGQQFWAGWAMIGALAYSVVVGVLLGHLKKPVVDRLHDKALHAETVMNRAQWMSEGAAIVGITLVAFGLWWGDAAAAAFISIEIVHDGWVNMRLVLADIMDEAPSALGTHQLEDVVERVRKRVMELDWVSDAGVRLREHGRVLTGDIFVVPNDGVDDVVARVADAANAVRDVDWRLHDIVVMPVSRLSNAVPPKADH
jgi:cation diffusion facilitator family transporter